MEGGVNMLCKTPTNKRLHFTHVHGEGIKNGGVIYRQNDGSCFSHFKTNMIRLCKFGNGKNGGSYFITTKFRVYYGFDRFDAH